jgi:hypothetical protein
MAAQTIMPASTDRQNQFWSCSHGCSGGLASASDGKASSAKFTGSHVHRKILRAGHNVPQEEPEAFAAA